MHTAAKHLDYHGANFYNSLKYVMKFNFYKGRENYPDRFWNLFRMDEAPHCA